MPPYHGECPPERQRCVFDQADESLGKRLIAEAGPGAQDRELGRFVTVPWPTDVGAIEGKIAATSAELVGAHAEQEPHQRERRASDEKLVLDGIDVSALGLAHGAKELLAVDRDGDEAFGVETQLATLAISHLLKAHDVLFPEPELVKRCKAVSGNGLEDPIQCDFGDGVFHGESSLNHP